jgi:uncharacterized damage-inducible protein DinB
MNLVELLQQEFDQEMDTTRRVLERVPEDRLDWRPHPRSGTLGWLASHIATIPRWTAEVLNRDEVDVQPPGGPPPPPAQASDRSHLLRLFDDSMQTARSALARAQEEQLGKPWRLLRGGQEIFRRPRAQVLRSFVLNHLIHHRAQLCVYLRLNEVPVPSVYGPSADEDPFRTA